MIGSLQPRDTNAGGAGRALLVELFGSHEGCLYSHAVLLRELGYRVDAAVAESLTGKLPSFIPPHRRFALPTDRKGVTHRGLLRACRLLRDTSYDLLLFNTFRSRCVRTVLAAASASLSVVGFHHNPDRLRHSVSQRIMLRRCRKILVAGHRVKRCAGELAPAADLESFYPVYRDEPARPLRVGTPLIVAVPGSLSYKKRAYDWLIDQAAQRAPAGGRVEFRLLGNASRDDGPCIAERIRRAGLADRIRTWNHFLPPQRFRAELEEAHLVMPLIHPEQELALSFHTSKTSGAIMDAHSTRRPLLLEEHFRGNDGEYDTSAFFYAPDNFAALVRHMLHEPSGLRDKAASIAADPRFQLTAQARRIDAWLRRP